LNSNRAPSPPPVLLPGLENVDSERLSIHPRPRGRQVVIFVAKATKLMSEAGMNVIIEGREAMVNHIPTPHRFALVLDDPQVTRTPG